MHPAPAQPGRREWTPPQVMDLPPLVDLTLQTGIPGGFTVAKSRIRKSIMNNGRS